MGRMEEGRPELAPLHSSLLSQETGAPGRATHLRTCMGETLSSWGQGGNQSSLGA